MTHPKTLARDIQATWISLARGGIKINMAPMATATGMIHDFADNIFMANKPVTITRPVSSIFFLSIFGYY
jgi:hypothetical protein